MRLQWTLVARRTEVSTCILFLVPVFSLMVCRTECIQCSYYSVVSTLLEPDLAATLAEQRENSYLAGTVCYVTSS